MSHFSKKTLRALLRKGISITGLSYIPNAASDLPFATGETGYLLNDNGTGRLVSFTQVLELAS